MIFKRLTKPDYSHRKACFSIWRRISGSTWCKGSWPEVSPQTSFVDLHIW